jgi:hypothetical protein
MAAQKLTSFAKETEEISVLIQQIAKTLADPIPPGMEGIRQSLVNSKELLIAKKRDLLHDTVSIVKMEILTDFAEKTEDLAILIQQITDNLAGPTPPGMEGIQQSLANSKELLIAKKRNLLYDTIALLKN